MPVSPKLQLYRWNRDADVDPADVLLGTSGSYIGGEASYTAIPFDADCKRLLVVVKCDNASAANSRTVTLQPLIKDKHGGIWA